MGGCWIRDVCCIVRVGGEVWRLTVGIGMVGIIILLVCLMFILILRMVGFVLRHKRLRDEDEFIEVLSMRKTRAKSDMKVELL
jgi:hypothetical protein